MSAENKQNKKMTGIEQQLTQLNRKKDHNKTYLKKLFADRQKKMTRLNEIKKAVNRSQSKNNMPLTKNQLKGYKSQKAKLQREIREINQFINDTEAMIQSYNKRITLLGGDNPDIVDQPLRLRLRLQ